MKQCSTHLSLADNRYFIHQEPVADLSSINIKPQDSILQISTCVNLDRYLDHISDYLARFHRQANPQDLLNFALRTTKLANGYNANTNTLRFSLPDPSESQRLFSLQRVGDVLEWAVKKACYEEIGFPASYTLDTWNETFGFVPEDAFSSFVNIGSNTLNITPTTRAVSFMLSCDNLSLDTKLRDAFAERYEHTQPSKGRPNFQLQQILAQHFLDTPFIDFDSDQSIRFRVNLMQPARQKIHTLIEPGLEVTVVPNAPASNLTYLNSPMEIQRLLDDSINHFIDQVTTQVAYSHSQKKEELLHFQKDCWQHIVDAPAMLKGSTKDQIGHLINIYQHGQTLLKSQPEAMELGASGLLTNTQIEPIPSFPDMRLLRASLTDDIKTAIEQRYHAVEHALLSREASPQQDNTGPSLDTFS